VQGEAALFPSGTREPSRRLAAASRTAAWLLFVVPAGRYDLVTMPDSRPQTSDIEIPPDRTRLKFLQ
jgi:hypothetical protein